MKQAQLVSTIIDIGQRVRAYFLGIFTSVSSVWDRTDPNSLTMERTRLAYERTMMAWIRTGVSLISFGFSIYKFFQIQELSIKGAFEEGLMGPRGFGAVMILSGLAAVGLATGQHRRDLADLRAAGMKTPPSLAIFVGGLVVILGFLGLLAMALKQ